MYTRLLFLLLCSYAGIANAVTAVGRVATITVANNSFVELFQLDKPIENSPRCNESQRFSNHLQPPSGIAAYLALLAAKQQGYTVLNEGTNISSNECKSEDVRTITFNWPST